MASKNADPPASSVTFKYLNHAKRDDGSVTHYNVEVTDERSEKVATISIEPRHLSSARSMKTILLARCMVYSVTQKAHDQMLLEMFAHANDRAEIAETR